MGQSATASVPSRMASVSRLGDATEPVSRWSRPITIGALISPDATSSFIASPKRARAPWPSQQIRDGRPWNATFAKCVPGLSDALVVITVKLLLSESRP